jgi:hypothetical protein
MFRRRIARLIVLSLACVEPLSLAASDGVERDGFISKIGTYRLYHGELTLRIYEDEGKLNYEIGHTISYRLSLLWRYRETVASGPAEPFIEQGSKWFAVAESPRARSPHSIWIFDGRDLLIQIAYDPAGDRDDYWGAVEYHSDSRPSIVTDAPRAVRDRLPESFKQRFSGGSRQGSPAMRSEHRPARDGQSGAR